MEPWAVTPSQESKSKSASSAASSSSSIENKYISFGAKGQTILGIEYLSENGGGTSSGFDFADQDMVTSRSLICEIHKDQEYCIGHKPAEWRYVDRN